MESTPRRFRKQVAPMPWSLDRNAPGDDGAAQALPHRLPHERLFYAGEFDLFALNGLLKHVMEVIVMPQRRWDRWYADGELFPDAVVIRQCGLVVALRLVSSAPVQDAVEAVYRNARNASKGGTS